MRKVLTLAALQVLVILSWASYHEYVWASAPTFRIPLRPRDPFDLLRGRYFVLNPLDSVVDSRSQQFPQADVERLVGSSGAFTGAVQVGFCPVDDEYRVCAMARLREKPPEQARFWCRGHATAYRREGQWEVKLDLGLHRFFIPNRLNLPAHENQTGWQVEVSYRPGLSALPRRLLFKGTPIDLR
jgi:uncharacterized membrane-anchored protein